MWTTRTKIGWSLLLAGAVLIGLFAARYYTFDPQVYFQRDVYQEKTVGLMTHISGMIVAVVAGPFQFHRGLRESHFGVHRLLGTVYIVSATIGALGGLYMAPFSASGAVTHVAFGLMGLGTLLSTSVALARIRSGNVQSHREWMTRSYTLIFGGVTLRLYAGPLEATFGEHVGYAVTAWACWVPNLAFAEWLIRSRLRRHPEAPKGMGMQVRQAT
jgi:uncharacterized membrane protein